MALRHVFKFVHGRMDLVKAAVGGERTRRSVPKGRLEVKSVAEFHASW